MTIKLKAIFQNETFTFLGNCNGYDSLITGDCTIQFSR